MADAKDCLAWTREKLPELLAEQTDLRADASRVAVMGHSAGAMLALQLGAAPSPPAAILCSSGLVYLSDPFWTQPLPAMASVPTADPAFIAEIYNGPVALTSAPMFTPAGPNNSTPRTAWMINAMKAGSLYPDIIKDGNTERVDPATGFSESFPPTCFVHGTGDDYAPYRLIKRANDELKAKGVEVEYVEAEGQSHVFDMFLKEEDALFKDVVMKGLDFLKRHV